MPARPEKEIKEEVDDYRKDVIILQEERLINVSYKKTFKWYL